MREDRAMISSAVRGIRMANLVGRGRANGHTEPQLVAGDSAILAWHDYGELSRDSALAMVRYLDRPRTAIQIHEKGRLPFALLPVAAS